MNDSFSLLSVPYSLFFLVATAAFGVALIGAVDARNFIVLFICLEIMQISVAFLALASSFFLSLPVLQIVSIVIFAMAGADSALGLGLLVVFFRKKFTVRTDVAVLLRG